MKSYEIIKAIKTTKGEINKIPAVIRIPTEIINEEFFIPEMLFGIRYKWEDIEKMMDELLLDLKEQGFLK